MRIPIQYLQPAPDSNRPPVFASRALRGRRPLRVHGARPRQHPHVHLQDEGGGGETGGTASAEKARRGARRGPRRMPALAPDGLAPPLGPAADGHRAHLRASGLLGIPQGEHHVPPVSLAAHPPPQGADGHPTRALDVPRHVQQQDHVLLLVVAPHSAVPSSLHGHDQVPRTVLVPTHVGQALPQSPLPTLARPLHHRPDAPAPRQRRHIAEGDPAIQQLGRVSAPRAPAEH
mmetsp:Transcript_15565/g.35882  ORF Transcript_15565/g.35882 Transcript_15565/m.35882 type:complete len:232 (-) Transcript_15565:867-1562(-)